MFCIYYYASFSAAPPRARPPPRYASTQVTLHNVPPKELVLYAKETQTKEIEPEGYSQPI